MMIFFLLFLFPLLHAFQERTSEFSLGSPHFDWYFYRHSLLQQSLSVTTSTDVGSKITTAPYFHTTVVSKSGWKPAVVPGTVLASLLQGGYVKNITDPYYERNLEEFPDISSVGRDYYTYWWITNFTLPPSSSKSSKSSKSFLSLRGINYKAEVYLNQKLLQTIDNHNVEGQFQRHLFDITSALTTNTNLLAILVYPVPYPGVPGGQGGDHVIAKNAATSQYTAGWDWVQATPDRNTGIWDKISIIQTSGKVLLQNPRIKTKGIGPTQLKVEVGLYNSDDSEISGKVSYTVEGSTLTQSLPFSLKPRESKVVVFNPSKLTNPKLWWPYGYGTQEMYNMSFIATIESNNCKKSCLYDQIQPSDDNGSGKTSDQIKARFGVRDISWELGGAWKNGYKVSINNQPIFIRGGNWIATDQLLRFSTDSTVYQWHIQMHKDMGMNMIRVWGGGLAERPEFFDICDEEGILVLQDFWMTGDSNGRWGGDFSYPEDHNLYLECVEDTVLMLRNHPSLVIYVGGNELSGESNPPQDIAKTLLEWLMDTPKSLDGTRLFLLSTMGPDGPTYALAPSDGPYGFRPLRDWFQPSPGLSVNESFNPEVGGSMMPVMESLRRFFSPSTIEDFPTKSGPCEEEAKTNKVWDFHKWQSYCDTDHIDAVWMYGKPKTSTGFLEQAQLAMYSQYRAVFEGFSSQMWDSYTGVLLWKSQGPWTELRGHTYDYYGDQNSAFFGIKKALEPVHVQLNLEGPSSWRLCVVNTAAKKLNPATIIVTFYDKLGKQLSSSKFPIDGVKPNSRSLFNTLSWPKDVPTTNFVFLRLQLVSGSATTATTTTATPISENVYWLTDPGQKTTQNAFVDMQDLKQNCVTLNASLTTNEQNGEYITTVTLQPKGFAFFVRLSLIQPQSYSAKNNDNRILPSFYSDNYLTLFPGETRSVKITCKKELAVGSPRVMISGWNVKPMTVG